MTSRNWDLNSCIDAIRNFERKNGRLPFSYELNANNNLPNNKTILRHSGMYYTEFLNTYLNESNIAKKSKYYFLDDDELLELLREELLKIKSTTMKDYKSKRSKDLPSVSYLFKRFNKTWNELIETLNLEANKNTLLTKEEIIQMFYDLKSTIKKVPSLSDMMNLNSNVKHAIYIHYGNYEKFCNTIGETSPITLTTVKHSDEDLIRMYMEFSEKIGHPATHTELDESSEIYNSNIFVIRFGGLNELREIIGYETHASSKRKYSKEILLDKLISIYHTHGKLTNKELNKIIPTTTILRYFKTTKMSVVWDEVMKSIENKD